MAKRPDDINSGNPDRTAELATANTELRQEIEEKAGAENLLRQLNQRVIQSQDEERRRIARELHDSIGQDLCGIAMSLSAFGKEVPTELLAQVQAILKQVDGCVKDVRTISHLLHPPLLDEVGLPSALEWYIREFSKRSQISVDLVVPPDLGRMKAEVETAVFRISQESLMNIHRHSGARSASLRIECVKEVLRMSISDNGTGISAEKLGRINAGQSGVGLAGMKERVKQLGGKFLLHSDSQGTVLHVELPLKR